MPSGKIALVTAGATYPFTSLVAASLSASFLNTLVSLGYTDLHVQHGTASFTPPSNTTLATTDNQPTIKISGFTFAENIRDMIARVDLVVCHAGAGSVLDALRFQKRCVIVPNRELMGNHQEELADELERQGYAVKGECGELAVAVSKAEEMTFTQFPESKSGILIGVMEEEMGMFRLD